MKKSTNCGFFYNIINCYYIIPIAESIKSIIPIKILYTANILIGFF